MNERQQKSMDTIIQLRDAATAETERMLKGGDAPELSDADLAKLEEAITVLGRA